MQVQMQVMFGGKKTRYILMHLQVMHLCEHLGDGYNLEV